jgi:prolyl-tRNA synthetase
MGGSLSHEFMVPASSGEDQILYCEKCKYAGPINQKQDPVNCPKCKAKLEKITAIEIGHIFQLGTKYSKVQGANYLDAKGVLKPVIMGCYGIGVSRLLSAIIEQNNDEDGIIWPGEVAPYSLLILPLNMSDTKTKEFGFKIYDDLSKQGFSVLLDDRPERAGVKFNDADLIGIPLRIIIGEENLKKNKIEIVIRKTKKSLLIDSDASFPKIKQLLSGL